MYKRITWCLTFWICALLITSAASPFQPIILLSPITDVAVNDTAEFSRSVAGCEWDMDDIRDIPFDCDFYQPSISSEVWCATFMSTGAFFYPLFKGYATPGDPHYCSFYTPGMPYGPLNPIDANRFTRLSFRMAMPQKNRSNIFVAWTKSPETRENYYLAFVDGENAYSTVLHNPDGFCIYDIDLTAKNFFRERIASMFVPPLCYGEWSGTVYGFLVQPSQLAGPGTNVKVDWIRLYNPDESPTVLIKWQSSSQQEEGYFVRLYLDMDAKGYDGDLFMSGLEDDGEFALQTAALPAGEYYVYLELVYRSTAEMISIGYSDYSGKITIREAPEIKILAPSYSSGSDYAELELENPWDMSDASDIEQYHINQMTNISFGDNILTALANPRNLPPEQSDAYFWLNQRRRCRLLPIDASKYRYLTFRINVEEPGYTNIIDRIARGWMSRVVWSSDGLGDLANYGSYSQEIPLLEGWRNYSVDLWDTNLLENSGLLPGSVAQLGWLNSGRVAVLRFDPLESPPTWFHIDEIKLCAMNTPNSNGVYSIRWSAESGLADGLNVKVFARCYMSSSAEYEEFLLAELTQVPGSGGYDWDTRAWPAGDYYVKIQAEDEYGNYESCLSRVPIRIAPAPQEKPEFIWAFPWGWSGAIPVSGDYDGDGTSDFAVYDSNTGYWYIITVTGKLVAWTFGWGWPGAIPASGDFDGDGRWDVAVMDAVSGYWFISSLEKGIIQWAFPWGWPGVSAQPGYYDNDTITDVGIFDLYAGKWYLATGREPALWAKPLSWGWPGAWPVPGDYDGDGKYDLAVFDQNSGTWFIRSVTGELILWSQAWGWPGAWPVPGDYDGDGRHDLAVFDQNTGAWFVLSTDIKLIAWNTAWGWPGAWPVPGDYVGDRADDFAVFDSNTGWWFVRPVTMP